VKVSTVTNLPPKKILCRQPLPISTLNPLLHNVALSLLVLLTVPCCAPAQCHRTVTALQGPQRTWHAAWLPACHRLCQHYSVVLMQPLSEYYSRHSVVRIQQVQKSGNLAQIWASSISITFGCFCHGCCPCLALSETPAWYPQLVERLWPVAAVAPFAALICSVSLGGLTDLVIARLQRPAARAQPVAE